MRRRLERVFGPFGDETGPLPDMPLLLSHRDGLLRVAILGELYACAASGLWVDDCAVSLREFIAMSPWRLRGRTVRLKQGHDALWFNSNRVRRCEVRAAG